MTGLTEPAAFRPVVLIAAVVAAAIAAAPVGAADISVSSVVVEFDLPVDLAGGEVPLGGLSGVAYDPACDLLYAVSDDRGHVAPPRVHVLRLDLAGESVRSLEVITLRDADGEPFERGVLDPEAVALAPDGTLWVASEGVSHRGIPPRIMGFRLDGALLRELEVPPAYLPTGDGSGVLSNHGFEGVTVTPDGSRVVAAVESALIQDGPAADLENGSTARIVVFDAASGQPVAERAYRIEPVPDEPVPPTAHRSIGVSEILALDAERLLVVERSFSAGVGNRVRIFLADLMSGDDVTGLEVLPRDVKPVTKSVVVDLGDLGFDPDNLEGISFGPVLPDGRSTLVMVGDNNFQPAAQPNQLLVLEVAGATAPSGRRVPTRVSTIQGAGHVSPLVGRCVDGVEGVVTAVLGRRSGQAFWIQQTPGDDDPATSDGLFVTALEGTAEVSVGDRLRLTGRVEDPRWRLELPVTRLVADGLETAAHDAEMPPPVVLGKAGRPIPTPVIDDDGLALFEPESDAVDFFESLEGMRVRVNDAVVVGPTSDHGEIVILGDGGAGSRPRSGRGGVVVRPEDNHPERIIIDDRLVADPPAVAVGDRLAGQIDGVLHYSYGSYKLLNTAPLEVVTHVAAEPPTTRLTAGEDSFTVATFNVENLFAGADEAELAALADTIVQRMNAPTVLALQEIQDDSGPEDDDTVTASATLGRLVNAVAGSGGPRYTWAQIDPENNADGGRPGANIRVVLLFDPARAALVAASDTDLRENPGLIFPSDPVFTNSRKPLAVELEVDGEPIFVVVCHLRSKGGDDPLFGRRQPPMRRSEDQRRPQAAAVRELVDKRLAADPVARIVVLGDLNDFEFSEPVGLLSAPPMVNLMGRLPEAERSTYVFLGNSQTLDHIIVSPVLADGAEIEVVHVNADFPKPERTSDHDPVVARFRLR